MASIDRELRNRLMGGYVPSYDEAVSIQIELKKAVSDKPGFKNIRTVAGADLAISRAQKKLVAGLVLFSYPDLEVLERVYAISGETFPYIPGLLAFREAPAVIKAFGRLGTRPDLLIMDGHGIAHPRGVGVASHLGVLIDIPAVGVAKKRLYGEYEEPGVESGCRSELKSREGKVLGAVLRTRRSVKPVFVSVGHRIDLERAVEVVMACSRGYRIPEPTRQADKYVAEIKRSVSL